MQRFLPLALFAVLLALLGAGLTLKPSELPSTLIDKPAPAFRLPLLDNPARHMDVAALQGQVWLLNVWASWCVSCRAEHETLMRLTSLGIAPIYGLNMKDDPRDAQQWLQERGNPYRSVFSDADGRASMDYGVYGVPETFIIDRHGRVRYRHAGPLDETSLRNEILPLLAALKAERDTYITFDER